MKLLPIIADEYRERNVNLRREKINNETRRVYSVHTAKSDHDWSNIKIESVRIGVNYV